MLSSNSNPNTNVFTTDVLKKHLHNHARVTKITTPHGTFLTPSFMPVGTRAFVNHLSANDLETTGSQIILGGNTYHMLCHPGLDVIRSLGGMHQLMHWPHSMLTDSGGYQVFSLSRNSKICRIDRNGAHFKHPNSGQLIHLTPKTSITAQKVIGADIIMAFDQCTPETGGREVALAALERTHRWLLESRDEHENNIYSDYGRRQALFGIIQGGGFRDLREQSAEFVVNLNLDGYAIGGEVIGYYMAQTCEIIEWIRAALPEQKIRYTMGVGLEPQDLIDVVARGIDIFDCVAPTRNARHGSLYCGKIIERNNWLAFINMDEQHASVDGDEISSNYRKTNNEKTNSNGDASKAIKKNSRESCRILIKKNIYAKDETPIMDGCMCYTCQNYSRAYLHYLFKQNATLYSNLACIHNVHVMQEICRRMQAVIMR